ncbi:MAG: flagellar protein [Bacteroidetes bacterium]|jgi:flagellar operon protein|nr:flagellar protein [Bacteroidota bacterium]HOV99664.1 TIGR02530 family flagellar biosynthesis protein [Bacteroidota bacterium]
MGEIINGVQVPFLPVGGVEGLKEKPFTPLQRGIPEKSFEEILTEEIEELKFSKHAQQRLESQNINLSNEDLQNIAQAVHKAESKGANEALVLLRDLAFVVSVKNHTIVTAIDSERMKENVFTNIDSAVIAG